MTHDLLRPDVVVGTLDETQHMKVALPVDVEEALTTVESSRTGVNWRSPLPSGNWRPLCEAKGQIGRANPLHQPANEGEITCDSQAIEAINGQHTAAGRASISGSQRVTPRFLQRRSKSLTRIRSRKYENLLRRPQSVESL